MKIKKYLPYIFIDMVEKMKYKSKNFNSFSEALSECQDGYENNKILRVVYEKTKRYRDLLNSKKTLLIETTPFMMDYLRIQACMNLAVKDGELNVIDFGGGCGIHYFVTKSIWQDKVKLNWCVVETPSMVEMAKKLEDDNLKFYSELNNAKKRFNRIDLILSSSTLHYVPDPYKTLEELINCYSNYIFITLTGLTTNMKEMFSVQKSSLTSNGFGPLPEGIIDENVRYPISIARKDKFEEILKTRYSIKIVFNENTKSYLIGDTWIGTYGYFGKLLTDKQ